MSCASYAQENPRIFVTDSNSWQIAGSAGGSNGNFGAHMSGGASPQTAEIIKTFGQRCPEVIANNRPDASDYVVELDHEGGKGLLRHKDKVAVFARKSGDSIFSESTLSVGGSVQGACRAILDHWTAHKAELKAAVPVPPSNVKPVGEDSASSAPLPKANLVVSSDPTGADIEIDGEFVGNTPSTIHLAAGEYQVTIRKKSFATWQRKVKITGGDIKISADLDQLSSAPANH